MRPSFQILFDRPISQTNYRKLEVTAINFTLPLFSLFECDTEYTEYSKETDKSFFIYQIIQNQITIKQIFINLTEHKKIFAKGPKTISNYSLFLVISHYFHP
jgi:hypothetical protein